MLGVILCGGQSTRMGSDKGLLRLEAQSWAQTAADKFNLLQLSARVSVNATQQTEYAQVFDPRFLVTDNNTIPVKGPLLGLLSVHLQYPDEDLFVLACDMPLMDPSLLKELYQVFNPQKAAVFVFTNAGEPEPLCGIYSAAGLRAILDKMMHKELQRFSMKYVLEQLSIYSVPIREDQKISFRNFNAQDELKGL